MQIALIHRCIGDFEEINVDFDAREREFKQLMMVEAFNTSKRR